jgi:uncharacterized repeat protein (TIGR01451 family)
MKKTFNAKSAYAAVLALAALSGWGLAVAQAHAATVEPAPATTPAVTIASEAMIERVVLGPDGSEKLILKKPGEVVVVPGDKVVFTLTYQNKGAEPASGFKATNPMPGPVQFIEAAQDWADVSVDGGANWGKLDTLKVMAAPAEGAAAVERAATPADVTHVRWVFAKPIAAGSKGSISFRGVIK